MNILIIEDEPQAAQRVEKLIEAIVPNVKIVAKLDSVKSSVQWFTSNPQPDLAIMDIQLADGLSFDIFQRTKFFKLSEWPCYKL